MSDRREILVERIDLMLTRSGRSARDVSMVATGKPDLIRDLKRRKSIPKAAALAAVAEEFGTTSDYLLGLTDNPNPIRSEVSVSDRHFEWKGADRESDTPPPIRVPGEERNPADIANLRIAIVGTGDCASIEVTTTDGQAMMVDRSSFDPEYHVRYIVRPPALQGDRDAYAIYFHGESMVPRFRPGEIGFAQPSRPPAPGDDVIIQLNGGESGEVESVIVKQLVRQTAKEVVLEQFNPPAIFTLPRRQVVRMHRILPSSEMFFR